MENNYKIIPFDIEKAKAGAEVVTKNGRSARIICYDKKLDTEFSKNPIVALLSYTGKYGTTYELTQSYTLKGKIDNREDNNDDLFLKIPVKTRRMTNQELSWWLRECPDEHREWSTKNADDLIYHIFDYVQHEANEECSEDILIRSNGEEWREPLIEIE